MSFILKACCRKLVVRISYQQLQLANLIISRVKLNNYLIKYLLQDTEEQA